MSPVCGLPQGKGQAPWRERSCWSRPQQSTAMCSAAHASTSRAGSNAQMRPVRLAFGTPRRLSKLATHSDGIPSPGPSETSVGMLRIVRVTRAASTPFSTGMAADLVMTRKGRRCSRAVMASTPARTAAARLPEAPLATSASSGELLAELRRARASGERFDVGVVVGTIDPMRRPPAGDPALTCSGRLPSRVATHDLKEGRHATP